MTPPISAIFEFPQPDASLTYQTPAPGPLVVQSQVEYTDVAEKLKTIKMFQRRVVDFFLPHKRLALEAHRALCDDERKALQPSVDDEFRIKRALVVYTTEQDRIRREEQARLQREQRERDEVARLEQAAALEVEANATGDVAYREAANHLLEAPVAVATVEPSTPAAPKVEGLSYRDSYHALVLDLLTLVKEVAAGRQPLGLVMANQSALDGLARSLKQSMAVPGVRLMVDKTPVTRTR